MPMAAVHPQAALAYVASLLAGNDAGKTVPDHGKILWFAFKQAVIRGRRPMLQVPEVVLGE